VARKISAAAVFLLLLAGAAVAGEPPKFIVAIVGANVHQGHAPAETCAVDVPGGVLYDGAKLALDSDRVKDAARYIALEAWDDGGCEPQAEAIARIVRTNPNVLAVIGHATSATTRAAARLYAEAGIPLLAPMATSPYILYPDWQPDTSVKGRLLRNVFRLPPGDREVQAPAAALVAAQILTTQKCLLATDVSAEAQLYSHLLGNDIKRLLQQKGKTVEEVTVNSQNTAAAVQQAMRLRADLIIYCGYPTAAKRLLAELAKSYGNGSARPRLLFTDGANVPDLDVHGVDAYMTYPVPDLGPYPKDLQKDVAGGNNGYEVYAYDAMLLLGQVIDQCRGRGRMGRSCVLNGLAQSRSLNGAASTYSFAGGENLLSAYYLYHADGTKPGKEPHFEYLQTIPSYEIVAFAAGLQQ